MRNLLKNVLAMLMMLIIGTFFMSCEFDDNAPTCQKEHVSSIVVEGDENIEEDSLINDESQIYRLIFENRSDLKVDIFAVEGNYDGFSLEPHETKYVKSTLDYVYTVDYSFDEREGTLNHEKTNYNHTIFYESEVKYVIKCTGTFSKYSVSLEDNNGDTYDTSIFCGFDENLTYPNEYELTTFPLEYKYEYFNNYQAHISFYRLHREGSNDIEDFDEVTLEIWYKDKLMKTVTELFGNGTERIGINQEYIISNNLYEN